jgi:hypothetical protein
MTGIQYAQRQLRELDLDVQDVIVVRDMLRFRALVTEQVAHRYGGSHKYARRRLGRLRELGLVQQEPNWIAGTKLWTATQLGARVVKDHRPVQQLKPAALLHDLALVDLADLLRRDNPYAYWRTEREIMSDRQRAAQRGSDVDFGHRPDGLLIEDGRRIAIELELSKKPEGAYARICRWYAAQPFVDGLRWYVGSRAIWARIALELDWTGMDRCLHVEIHDVPSEVRVRNWSSKQPRP